MDKNDIDEFGRCVTEFRESVVAFGAIQALMAQRTAWEACNTQRLAQGNPIVYREEDFNQLAAQIQGIVK
jgi:hypothetical protein